MTLEVWTDSKIQKCILKKFVKKENGLHGESKNLKYIFVQRIKGSKRIFMFYSIKIPFLIWIGRMFWKNVVISNSICLKNLIKFEYILTISSFCNQIWLQFCHVIERFFADTFWIWIFGSSLLISVLLRKKVLTINHYLLFIRNLFPFFQMSSVNVKSSVSFYHQAFDPLCNWRLQILLLHTKSHLSSPDRG